MKRTILLADDSSTIQRLVAQTFDDENFEVVSVSNGDAAVKKFEEIRPAAVLADVFMPGKDGYEVCAFVKEHPVLDRTPVILLVGAFEAYDEAQAERVGAAGKISKPFEPQELMDLVVSVLNEDSSAMAEVESGTGDEDILGLGALFPSAPHEAEGTSLSEEQIEGIADRVIRKLSAEVIEGVAWDVVPDIAERVVREELKRQDAG
jgi:CheY-like chemotaxis protein